MKKLIEQYPFSTATILLLLWIVLYTALQPLADAFISVDRISPRRTIDRSCSFLCL